MAWNWICSKKQRLSFPQEATPADEGLNKSIDYWVRSEIGY